MFKNVPRGLMLIAGAAVVKIWVIKALANYGAKRLSKD